MITTVTCIQYLCPCQQCFRILVILYCRPNSVFIPQQRTKLAQAAMRIIQNPEFCLRNRSFVTIFFACAHIPVLVIMRLDWLTERFAQAPSKKSLATPIANYSHNTQQILAGTANILIADKSPAAIAITLNIRCELSNARRLRRQQVLILLTGRWQNRRGYTQHRAS